MHAEATAATPAYNPADKPGRFARVLDVVRKLIDYGKALAEAVHQRTEKIDFAARACNFGTNDIELIIARITRGLLRARLLEEKLVRIAPRLVAKPRRLGRKPRVAPVARQVEATESHAANLYTPERIAAEVRRKPIGAVVADICRDFGILPCHPLWREIQRAIMQHGGNYAALVIDIITRPRPPGWHETSAAWLPPALRSPAPGGAGPP
jgi:hypothetical protein